MSLESSTASSVTLLCITAATLITSSPAAREKTSGREADAEVGLTVSDDGVGATSV